MSECCGGSCGVTYKNPEIKSQEMKGVVAALNLIVPDEERSLLLEAIEAYEEKHDVS